MTAGIPMATGVSSPVWPLPAVTRKSWNFRDPRKKGARHHAGVDLYAPAGSPVLATENGELIRSHAFLGPRAVALLFATDSGIVINYGEVFPRSWQDFGLRIGDRVEAGQPLARVGITPGGKSMLHFEAYLAGTRKTHQWHAGQPAPSMLLDPTTYLRTAAALDGGQDTDQIDDSVDDSADDDEGDPGKDIEDDPIDDSVVRPTGSTAGGNAGGLAVAIAIMAMLGGTD